MEIKITSIIFRRNLIIWQKVEINIKSRKNT